jgi:hypothetical protein
MTRPGWEQNETTGATPELRRASLAIALISARSGDADLRGQLARDRALDAGYEDRQRPAEGS